MHPKIRVALVALAFALAQAPASALDRSQVSYLSGLIASSNVDEICSWWQSLSRTPSVVLVAGDLGSALDEFYNVCTNSGASADDIDAALDELEESLPTY